ncbi:hypothetical protein EXT65_21065 [Pectobacterium carotovorum subsp. carotovorum]|nr:hypothetical protein [Pectobacterium carotovorum]MCL6336287.1 hypothetical protein [Pectobacterium carotovorum subsp. carotovorum]
MAYIDELKHLEFLVEQSNGVDKNLIHKANELISRSLNFQEQAYILLSKAYADSSNNNPELENNIQSQILHIENLDEITKEYQENEKEIQQLEEAELIKLSHLEPSGFTETNKELHDCAGKIVKKAKEKFKDEPVITKVWAYRFGGYNMISCDLFTQDRSVTMPVTISAVERQMLDDLDEPDVFDMAEAVHLVGLITQALDATVIVGLGRNEINPHVLAQPLGEGHTNGAINLWRQSAAPVVAEPITQERVWE